MERVSQGLEVLTTVSLPTASLDLAVLGKDRLRTRPVAAVPAASAGRHEIRVGQKNKLTYCWARKG
jgi:hypothetical protein